MLFGQLVALDNGVRLGGVLTVSSAAVLTVPGQTPFTYTRYVPASAGVKLLKVNVALVWPNRE